MPDDARTVTVAEPSTAIAVRETTGGGDLLSSAANFEFGQRVAKLFSASQLVPPHLRGNPADCFIALHMARRLGEDPLVTMQNIYIVSGRAGWSAQYMIGRANRSGVFQGRITWRTEGAGDAMSVTARATLAETGEEISANASMQMAKDEGWTKNPKYRTMPEHMLRWRSATMLIRLYCPEVMLGMQSHEELEDVAASGRMIDVTASREPETPDPFEAASRGETVAADPAHDLDTGEVRDDTPAQETVAGDTLVIEPRRKGQGYDWLDWASRMSAAIRAAETIAALMALDSAQAAWWPQCPESGRKQLRKQIADRAAELQTGAQS